MITLAVFDMAGTTIDDGGAVYRALQLAVEETGVAVAPEHLQTWMGAEKRSAIRALIELGGGDPDEPTGRGDGGGSARDGKVDRAFERFRTILGELYRDDPPVAMPGVPEAIAELQGRGIRVALTTGFSRDVATGILDRLGWVVRLGGIEGMDMDMGLDVDVNVTSAAGGQDANSGGDAARVVIDALVCADEVAAGRPAPYMIHRAMERTGTLSTDEVLVAGDTVVDVQAGANSGAAITIGVLSGKLGRDDFAGEPYTEVLESVAAIPAYTSRAAEL